MKRGFWRTTGTVLLLTIAGLILLAITAGAALLTEDPWGNFWKIAGVGALIIAVGQIGSRIDEQINARHQAVIHRLDEIARLLRDR
jgi:hypothetical protein